MKLQAKNYSLKWLLNYLKKASDLILSLGQVCLRGIVHMQLDGNTFVELRETRKN